MTLLLALAASSLALQPFSSGGLRQGMTQAEVSAISGQAIPADAREAEVSADGRRYLAQFCGTRLHALRATYSDVEWLSAVEWLRSQGFRLGTPSVTAREDGKEERRELRQPLSHPRAVYAVAARMISRSSPEGARVSYQLDFQAKAGCRMR